MTPALDYGSILTFLKGSDPPQKAENESTDDFQTRTIDWMKVEFKSFRVLVWAILLLQVREWAMGA